MSNTKDTIKDILRSFLLSKYNISFNDDINDLYDVSNKLVVSDIVGYTLHKSGIKNPIFDNSIYKSVNKYERIISCRKKINKLFNNDINYLFIKGLSYAKYYPEEYLRYCGDIDVVINKNDFDKAHAILINNGYREISRNKHEITLVDTNGISVDLHFLFFSDYKEINDIFIDCFNNNHELDINYSYLFLIAHCNKHFKLGSLKYRFFFDLYYLRKLIDTDFVNNVLKDIGLFEFNNSVNNYLDAFLGIKEYSDLDSKLEDFIFSCGEDMGINNRLLINNYGKSKLSYLLSRIFLPYDLLVSEYPKLRNSKLFLPYYHVKRIIRIANSSRGKYAINELKTSSKIDKKDVDSMYEFITRIGIK